MLPDVDFFHHHWYLRDVDALSYEQKTCSACFVGSSTGAWLDVDAIRTLATPRLHAAAYFDGNPRVMFRIANAVHCLSSEAKDLLERQPYFSSHVGWHDQLRHRFIISMDGNGATCSRLVKGLRSHSAVIKFDSVAKEEEVERVVETEAAEPGAFKAVAAAGKIFAAKYLTIGSVMSYTVRLIAAFAAAKGA